MKLRIIVSIHIFVVLVVLNHIMNGGSINLEIRDIAVIFLGFLAPALLNGWLTLRYRILNSLTWLIIAGLLWNAWSNSFTGAAWSLSHLRMVLVFAILVFGVVLMVNEIFVNLFSKKIEN